MAARLHFNGQQVIFFAIILIDLIIYSGKDIAIRQMGLRVCEVPHRDIVKSKVRYEWNSASQLDNPVMKILPFKEEIKPEYIFPRVVTDVYPIYVRFKSHFMYFLL